MTHEDVDEDGGEREQTICSPCSLFPSPRELTSSIRSLDRVAAKGPEQSRKEDPGDSRHII